VSTVNEQQGTGGAGRAPAPPIVGEGRRVRAYVGEADHWHGKSLALALVQMLHDEGAVGATVVRGLIGFGAHGRIHTASLPDIASPLPMIVEWVDTPERVERLLPRICEMVVEGLVTVETVQIAKFAHRALHDVDAGRSVGDAMTSDVTAVREDAPLHDLVRMLVGQGFRALPVLDGAGRVVGIVTSGDLIERGGLRARIDSLAGLDAEALRGEIEHLGRSNLFARHVMTAPVVRARPDEPLADAAHRMVVRRLKRLPVVEADGRLVGVLSRADVLRTVAEGFPHPEEAADAGVLAQARTVGEIARADVPTVGPDAGLPEVLDAVVSTRLLRAVVVDPDRRVLGVISDADLVRCVDPAAHPTLLQALAARVPFVRHRPEEQALLRRTPTRATDVMTHPAVTVPADAPLPRAIRTMLDARKKILLVVDADGRLTGAVDRADLLRAVAAGGGAR
jgi:CBS domain-containing protein/PII-like signaling protein